MTLATLDRNLGVIWIELLRHLWQSALVLSPLFLLAYVLRSAPARWSHRLWVAALAKLFVPLALFGPLIGAAWQRLFAGPPVPVDARGAAGFRALATAIGASSATPGALAIDRVPAPFFILCTLAYLAVACWLIARTSRDLVAARRLTRVVTPIDGERKSKLLAALRVAGIRATHVIVSDSNLIPAVVGTLRPRIVVPVRLLDALEVDELTAVLLHEEMHRRNADPAIAALQRVASSLLFFFPLLAPMQRRLRDAAELRCDEDALVAGAEPHAYVRALARTIQLGLDPSPAPAALGDGSRSLVARRLAKLREPGRVKTTTRHRLAIAAAVCILAAGVVFPVSGQVQYTVVKQWSVGPVEEKHEGYARIIVVSPGERTEARLVALAVQLGQEAGADPWSIVYVYDDLNAAKMWKDAGNEVLNFADKAWHDDHRIAIFNKTNRASEPPSAWVEVMLEGASGPMKPVALAGCTLPKGIEGKP